MTTVKKEVLQARSLHTLQRLLAPIVALCIARRRAKAATTHAARRYHSPPSETLRALPFFAKWPDSALEEWATRGVLRAYRKGTCIGFAREPPKVAQVYWVLSGKVTQVPTKKEFGECAAELPHLQPSAPKTGPAVLPALFVEDARTTAAPPLTGAQERIMDSLEMYHAGQLVDCEGLLLGGGRHRSLRCQTDVVLLSFPFPLVLGVVQGLSAAARDNTIDVARAVAESRMALLGNVPSVQSLTEANPVLLGLSPSATRALRLQLQPHVFLQFDTICHDVADADPVHFLRRGRVQIDDNMGIASIKESRASAAIGLDTFVRCRLPDYYGQKLKAKAATYCETWSISVANLRALCDAATRLRCTQASVSLLGTDMSRLALTPALRTCPCFADMTEAVLNVVARTLQPRVYSAGDTILPSKRCPATGIVLVAGTALVRPESKRAPFALPGGEACYFCECFVKMELYESVVAQSSCIVLHSSPGQILESIEQFGAFARETQAMLDGAQASVNRRYGTGASDLSKAQSAAAERVKAYRRRCMEEAAMAASKAPAGAATAAASPGDAATALENELLVSLSLQLQALHPDAVDAAKFAVFRGAQLAIPADTASTTAQPAPAYFTVDDEGNVVTCTEPHEAVAAQTVAIAPVPVPLAATVLAPPRLQGDGKKSTSAPPSGRASLAAPALRTKVRATAAVPKSERREVPPRLSTLRNAAAELRDEADGVNRRREFQRQLARVKHAP